jgi:hypothetical protein
VGGRRFILVAVAALVLTAAQPALARDPDASDSPRVSGPLVFLPYECEDNGTPGPHESAAQACGWWYDLAPLDTDPIHDFSAYWLQIELDPAKGQCVFHLEFDMELPESVQIVSASAETDRRITAKTEPVAELVVDGGGTAPVPGVISQDTLVSKGRERVRMTDHTYSYSWSGVSKDKVMVAVGVQLAHTSVPPELFYTWSEGQGVGWGSCRPIIIRVGPR